MNKLNIKEQFWKTRLISEEKKSAFFYKFKGLLRGNYVRYKNSKSVVEEYSKQILTIPRDRDKKYYKDIITVVTFILKRVH